MDEHEDMRDEDELDRVFREAARRRQADADFRRPRPESIVAYLARTATDAQVAEVQETLARSSRFRRELLEIAGGFEHLADLEPGVSAGEAPAVPSRRAALWRWRLEGWIPWLRATGRSAPGPFSPAWAAAGVAAVAALALVYPAYRGLRVPDLVAEAEGLRRGAAADDGEIAELRAALEKTRGEVLGLRERATWSGRLGDALVLDGAVRSSDRSGGDEILRVASGQPYIVVNVLVPSPAQGGTYRVEIRDAAGAQVWFRDLAADELEQDAESSVGLTMLLVPTALLPEGRYELVRYRVDREEPSGRVTVGFRVKDEQEP